MKNEHILIIEDDAELRENLVELLHYEGYTIFAAGTAAEAMTAYQSGSFDAVICDIKLPDMSGYTVFRNVKEDTPPGGMPVFIFLTGLVDREHVRKGMEEGVDDYITKPFSIEEVTAALRTQLIKKRQLRSAGSLATEKNKESEPEMQEAQTERLNYESFILVDKGTNSRLVYIKDILHISVDKDYSTLHTLDSKSYTLRRTLGKWETMLPQDKFLRIHRGTIINTNHIARLEKWFNYTYRVYLTGIKDPFLISQRFSRMFRSRFS